MTAKEQNTTLLVIASEASKINSWKDFSKYCFEREKGLRKSAFQNLSNFIGVANGWPVHGKIEFVNFLLPYFDIVDKSDFRALPENLSEGLIKSTLETWCDFEVANPNPFRWYGQYYKSEKHIFKALEIDPSDEKARRILIRWWTYEISFSLHHLPEGYIGDPERDLLLVDNLKEQILLLKDEEEKQFLINELELDLELIKNYLEWEKSGQDNFETWGLQNKRRVGYRLKHYN